MMHTPNLSESAEMYLKALIELSAREIATVSRLAGRLGVTQVSANEMVRRLSELGLMTHTPYSPPGPPTPAPDGKFEPLNGTPLSALAVGSTARILAIRETSTEVLQHL